MKRILIIAAAALFTTAPAMSQAVTADRDGILKKIARSDADIANDKKNNKPGVWLDRGKIFTEAATAPSTGLFKGFDEMSMSLMMGKPTSVTEREIAGVTYQVMSYPAYDAYFDGDYLIFWDTKTSIADNALEEAYRSYDKAYQIDAKSANKVKPGIIAVADAYKQDADNLFSLQRFEEGANDFLRAYEIQLHPAVNIIDTMSLFNAGFLYTVANNFNKGLENLNKAADLGFESEGEVYYYLFHGYFGLEDFENAREVLIKGLTKYPENNRIVEGLIGLYANTGDQDSAQDVIPIVMRSIEADPQNADLWGGLGRIYDKLGDQDKAIEAFAKSAELTPDDFAPQFNLGLLYLKKGDEMVHTISTTTYTSNALFQEDLAKANSVYEMAITPLERAHNLNPEEPATIELLKNVTFRLRDEPGMMEKYEKYNELFKQHQE